MGAALKRVPVEVFAEPADSARKAAPATARSLLRFITCGSVDDGKSTLLGRLLYETGSVFDDQIEALTRDSAKFGTTGKDLDFALLLDGLSAEREQGITIDVAYRYFSTPGRAFIAADTPGHEQYTRNMATGASTADVAIILVDARKGLLDQTRRHSYIVSMLGVRQVIVAVNKMDLVAYSQDTFREIERDYRELAETLGFTETHIVPLSARVGDNVTGLSGAMPWYRGPSLLHLIETIEPLVATSVAFRFPVQWVNRPNLDFRGYSGTVASGTIRVGDAVTVLPRGQSSRIAGILGPGGAQSEAFDGQSVTLSLANEVDISRGDVLVATAGEQAVRQVNVRLLALDSQPLTPGRSYIARIGTATTAARITDLDHQIDVHDYRARPANDLPMNTIGVATLRFETPVVATAYAECRALGSLLLIDPVTNETVALGVVDMADEGHADAPSSEPLLERLRLGLIRIGLLAEGSDGAATRRFISWRLFSAAAVALLVGLIAGNAWAGVLAGLADIMLRPLARIAHDQIWKRIAARIRARNEAALNLDGGGI